MFDALGDHEAADDAHDVADIEHDDVVALSCRRPRAPRCGRDPRSSIDLLTGRHYRLGVSGSVCSHGCGLPTCAAMTPAPMASEHHDRGTPAVAAPTSASARGRAGAASAITAQCRDRVPGSHVPPGSERGTRSASPAATRRRRSVDDTSSRGNAIRTAAPTGGSSDRAGSSSRSTIAERHRRRAGRRRGATSTIRAATSAPTIRTISRSGRAQLVDGVDRVRRPGTVELEPRRFETVDTVDRGRDHLVARFGRRHDTSLLLPRIAGDHEQHSIEREGVPGRGRRREVTHVDRIEGPAEDAQPLHAASVRERLVNAVLRRCLPGPARPNLPPVPNLLVRVWLPDRPGALGLVASRIGAIGGDIVGIDVLERSEHVAVDEFAVVLAERRSRQAAGTRDRRGRRRVGRGVARGRALPRPARSTRSSRCNGCASRPTFGKRCSVSLTRVRNEFAADWATRVARRRTARDRGYRRAARERPRRHSPPAPRRHPRSPRATPVPTISRSRALPSNDAMLLVGRDGHPFRRRERRQLLALARIADRLGVMIDAQRYLPGNRS